MFMTLQLLYYIKRVHNFIFLKLLKVFINLQNFFNYVLFFYRKVKLIILKNLDISDIH
jgi:hypothetical protein